MNELTISKNFHPILSTKKLAANIDPIGIRERIIIKI